MRKHLFFLLFVPLLSLLSCLGDPREKDMDLIPTQRTEKSEEEYTIIAHAAGTEEGLIPEWLRIYLQEGISGVEDMPQYKTKYLFMAENAGTNEDALEQWEEAFSVDQDLPLMVSVRMQDRLDRASEGNPDALFGRYYENTLRKTADARIRDGRKEEDFWLKKKFEAPREGEISREEYSFYILVSIDRAELQRQLTPVLSRDDIDPPLRKDEASAVDKMLVSFYDTF
ncbi:hypothetical protein LJC14_06760 [Treponema sp. OttesenSCG-928-L16]|nr:hypothetical protein [Treponema sp. OttesenSCG-928-L16]